MNLGPLTVDHFLVIVDERVALSMRGAPQLATGISWRLEAGEKPIALHAWVPPDRDKPAQVPSDRANGMTLGHQRGPAASQLHVRGAAPACAFWDGLTALDSRGVPIPRKRLSKPGHLWDGSGVGGLASSG